MASKSDIAEFRKAVAALRVLCPTDSPVRVSRQPLTDGLFGDSDVTKRGKRAYKIRVNSKKDIDFQIWVLVHEWAHCMTWKVTHERHEDHGAYFGIAYSEAYKAVYQ